MRWLTRHVRAGCALTVAVLLGGIIFATDPAGAMSQREEDTAIRGTVQLVILDGSEKTIGTCSGSLVDPAGYVLTAYHCVGITATGKDDTGQGLKPGDLYHPKGKLLVAPTKDERSIPRPVYVANYQAGDPRRDFAVLKVTGMLNAREALPNPLPVTVMPMADATQVRISDVVHVLGYPGIGGKLITVTSGHITGFDIEPGDDTPAYFKHDAGTAAGHSGGPMVSDAGAQLGIHSRRREDGSSSVKYGAMLSIVAPYLAKAKQLGGVVDPTAPNQPTQPSQPTQPNPPAQATPSPATTGPFGPLRFGTAYQNGRLSGEGATLPAGVKEIVAVFSYTNMKKGASWGNDWLYGGQVIGGRRDKSWKDEGSGNFALSLTNTESFAEGVYELVLYAAGREVRRGSVTVGRAQGGNPTPGPTPVAQSAAVVHGRLVDADTKKGIEGGSFFMLKPGTTLPSIQSSNDPDSFVAAQGVSDGSGSFTTAPGLPPGKYPILASARNYQSRFYLNGLTIEASDGNSIELESPVALQRK